MRAGKRSCRKHDTGNIAATLAYVRHGEGDVLLAGRSCEILLGTKEDPRLPHGQTLLTERTQVVHDIFLHPVVEGGQGLVKDTLGHFRAYVLGGQSADKELKAMSYRICCGLRLMQHQMTKWRSGNSLRFLSIFGRMYCSRAPPLDAPADECPAVKKKRKKQSKAKEEDDGGECNVTLATSQRNQWCRGFFIENIIYFKLLPVQGID